MKTRRVNYIVKIGENFSGSFPKLGKAREYIRSLLNYNAVNRVEEKVYLLKEITTTEIMNTYNSDDNRLIGKIEDIF